MLFKLITISILLANTGADSNDSSAIAIAAASTLLTTLGVSLIKSYFDNKARDKKLQDKEIEQDKKLEAKIQLVIGEIKGISNVAVRLEDKLDRHIDEGDFIARLSYSVENKAAQILSLSFSLHQKYKNMLSHWADVIEEFGKNFIQNKNKRKDKHNLEKILNQEIDICLNDFNIYIDSFDTELRLLNKKKYRFSKFIEENKLHNKTRLLVARLAENGFEENKDKLVEIFINYINDFFEAFLTAISVWKNLPIYEFNESN
jgi:hypothetical protein